MSTYIEFSDGDTAHIYDRFVQGHTQFEHVETGKIYEREKTAIKRAIIFHRKQVYASGKVRRKRKRIVHCRKIFMGSKNVKPSIVSFYENGELLHRVVETGKVYKRIKKAIDKAIEYVVQNSK